MYLYSQKDKLVKKKIELYAFYSNAELTEKCAESELTGMVVDWEKSSKRNRQSIYNTQINLHSTKELVEARRIFKKEIICRVNGGSYLDVGEISRAIDLGADYIMIPMIKEIEDIEKALKAIDGRAKNVLMIETQESLKLTPLLNQYPVDKVYIGLNDLAISRKSTNIFLPFIDGTVESLRKSISVDFGIAGLTHSDSGNPIPCHLIIQELKRLNCHFTFLRRSFYKDLANYSISEIIDSINDMYAKDVSTEMSSELKKIIQTITSPLI